MIYRNRLSDAGTSTIFTETTMQSGFKSEHFLDANGKPAGGTTYGNGFAIGWQNGPLGRDDERKEPNGAFVEDLIAATIDRIEFYENNGFGCVENRSALRDLCGALTALNARTNEREAREVEGTHEQ